MKKLMMFAAAMTIVGGAYASECAPGSEASPCDTPVWDFVMKGKTANGIAKGYKAVYSISYKGAIVGNLAEVTIPVPGTDIQRNEYITGVKTNNPAYDGGDVKSTDVSEVQVPANEDLPMPTAIGQTIITNVTVTTTTTHIITNSAGKVTGSVDGLITESTKLIELTMVDASSAEVTGECCLDTFTVYLYDKDAKDLIVFEDQEVLKMSVFGKGLVKELKPGQSASLESDVMWNLVGDEDIELQFVGFGKAKYGLSKGGTSGSVCNPVTEEPCEPSYDWPSWSGWFTGFFGPETDDSHDLNCAGDCVAVAGGTWSAKLNKKLSASSDPEAAIYRKFKVSYFFDDF